MRITSEVGGAAYAQQISAPQNIQSAPKNAEGKSEVGGTFDQINLSGETSGESRFQKELAARLVQDVRAATTTGDIQALRAQVRAGTYQINPSAIASAMLLGG